MITTGLRVGARSSTAPLRDVLVKRPGPAFGRAFADRAHGFLHAVDLVGAQREHDRLVETLGQLGARVHMLDVEPESDADLCLRVRPAVRRPTGAIALRPGKANRLGEPAILEHWLAERGVPIAGRIEAPGTVEAGDTVWLRDDLLVHRAVPPNERLAARASSRGSSAATSASSTCPTTRARPS